MATALTFTVDAILITGGHWTLARTDTGWACEVFATLEPWANGEPIRGTWYRQLEVLGFVSGHAATLPYDGESAPAATDVATDQAIWVGQTHASVASEWVGKTITVEVADAEL